MISISTVILTSVCASFSFCLYPALSCGLCPDLFLGLDLCCGLGLCLGLCLGLSLSLWTWSKRTMRCGKFPCCVWFRCSPSSAFDLDDKKLLPDKLQQVQDHTEQTRLLASIGINKKRRSQYFHCNERDSGFEVNW